MAEIAQVDERPEPSQPIRRFPRLLEVVIAELDATILSALARRGEVILEIGHGLNEEKKVLGHGKFQIHFEETFASLFSLRTAERYMKRARKADAATKNDKLSNFEAATDRGALEILEASRHAQAEVVAVSKRDKVNRESRRIYRLPLRLTSNEHNVVDALQKLPDWPRAEKKIIHLLRRLCVEYGLVNKDFWR